METRKIWLARAIDLLLTFIAAAIFSYFFFPSLLNRLWFHLFLVIYVPLLTFLLERTSRKTIGMYIIGKGALLATTRASLVLALLLVISAGGIVFRDLMNTSEKEFFSSKFAVGDKEWVKYQSDEKTYSIEFPSKPTTNRTNLPLPRTTEKLPFFEAKCNIGENYYSLCHVTLPSRWLKWNSTLLMKAALKVINRRIPGAKILKTSRHSYKKFPSIEYIVSKKGNIEVAGRLILDKNRLYKIEVSYPKASKTTAQAPLARFIQSFSL